MTFDGVEHNLRVFIVEFDFDEFTIVILETIKDSDVDSITNNRIKENKIIKH